MVALFEKYGSVIDLAMPLKSEGDNKGYAFVSFKDADAVTLVFKDLKNIFLRAKPLDIKYVKAECGPSHTSDPRSHVLADSGGSFITDLKASSDLKTLTFSNPSSGKELNHQLLDFSDAGTRKKVLSNPEIPRADE